MSGFRNSRHGSAVLLALIAVSVLALILSGSMERSTVDLRLAGQWTKRLQALETAQTALNLIAGEVLQKYRDIGSIDSMLGTVVFRTHSGGQYGVIITDNDDVGGADQDGDGNPRTDSDGIFRLEAAGAIGAVEQRVEGFFRIVEGDSDMGLPPGGGLGALGLCADNVDVTRAGRISGADYTPPGYPCRGAVCNGTPSGNPSRAGISYNAGTTANISGTPGGTPAMDGNAGIDCQAWERFAVGAPDMATKTYLAAQGPFNASADAAAFGTPADPRIVLVEGVSGETVLFNGNLNANGILIVRNCHVRFAGTFNFVGLVLIVDEGGGMDFTGTSGFFGSVVVVGARNSDAQTEVNIDSNAASIRYSTEGLNRAAAALSGAGGGATSSAALRLLAWRTL